MRARSWLFVPGDSERKLAKALTSTADVVIYDLEDAVQPARKDAARDLVSAQLQRSVPATVCVRINPIDTPDALDDLKAIEPALPALIMQPKVLSATCVNELAARLGRIDGKADDDPGATGIVALVTETAEMALGLPAVSRWNPRVRALTWGAEDLSAVLGATRTRDAQGRWLGLFEMARNQTLLAARAAGVLAIDTLYADFRDSSGLAAHADAACRDGFDGVMAIHPAQVMPIHEAFTPDAATLEHAKRVLGAFDAEPGAGAVQLDGRMLDRPHRVLAEKILARAG